MMKVLLLCAIVAVVVATTPVTIHRKQLAGPPTEFSLHKLPSPTAGALSSMSAMVPIDLTANDDATEYVWEQALPVDSTTNFIFTFASPHASNTQLSLTGPNGVAIDLSKHASEGTFPIGEESVPVTNYVFQNLAVGSYTLRVQTVGLATNTKLKTILDEASIDAYIIWFNYAPLSIYSHLNTYNSEVGENIGLVTRVYDTEALGNLTASSGSPAALRDVVSSATLVLDLPDGKFVDVEMHDDGAHYDLGANDGIYGAYIQAQTAGKYSAQAVVKGKNSEGVEFIRTTQHLITVVPTFHLTGTAAGTKNTAQNRIDIALGVSASDLTMNYRAYAEVWGKDSKNKDVAVCWVSSIVNIQDENKVVLELDLNWVALAKAQAPFTLKNVYMQDIDSSIPVASVDEIPLKLDAESTKHATAALLLLKPSTITEEMRNGVRPAVYARSNSTAGNGYLLMLHGYCSDTNPWVPSKKFTNAKFYLHASVSVSHDQFAKNVLTWADGFNSYAIVGHSQGGAVSTHLHNYYWSGSDNVGSGRVIQSVGTPYKGCGAAGTAASFGSLFGVGCGRNDDLTKDGSALWNVGITAPTRAKVNYFTTTYEQGKTFGDYCNLAMNLVLSFPNDGVTEFDFAKLDGAKFVSNTQKWCHSSGMKYPAQYTDETRNADINAHAAR